MDKLDLARAIFNDGAAGAASAVPENNTTTITAFATEDSHDGYVTVQIEGEDVSVPTTFQVVEGDACIISITNRAPVVTGVIGTGDRVGVDIDKLKEGVSDISAFVNGESAATASGNPVHITDSYASPTVDFDIHGRAHAWNQLADTTKWKVASSADASFKTENNGLAATMTSIDKESNGCRLIIVPPRLDIGHKYLVTCYATCSVTARMDAQISQGWASANKNLTAGERTFFAYVITAGGTTPTADLRLQFYMYAAPSNYTLKIEYPQLIDLTRIYGAGKEPTVDKFRADYPNAYYPYDAGSVKSVGGVNLLKPGESTTRNGVTYIVQSDGTVHAKGTATSSSSLTLIDSNWGQLNVNPFDGLGSVTLSGCPSGGSTSKYAILVHMYKTKGAAAETKYDFGDGVTFNADGYYGVQLYGAWIASGVTIDAVFKPQLERGSAATPYVPYGCIEVTSCGKNLIGETVSGYYVDNTNGKLAVDANYAASGFMAVTGDTDYTISFDKRASSSTPWFSIAFYGHDHEYIAGVGKYLEDGSFVGRTSFTSHAPAKSYYARCSWGTSSGLTDTPNAQFAVGTDKTYEPYKSERATIDLKGHKLRSLPDGTRDELTVDSDGRVTLVQRVGSVDLGTQSWSRNSTYNVMYAYVSGKKPSRTNIRCGLYSVVDKSYTVMLNGEISGTTSDTGFNIKDDIYTDVAAFKAAMSGVEFDYELATPQTIDLGTINPPRTLTGISNVRLASDIETDFSMTYVRDTAAGAQLASVMAAKTATNFLDFDRNGLVVGNHTGEHLGGNVQLTGEPAVVLRDNQEPMAKFVKNDIQLGMSNSEDASIHLLNGTGKMYTTTYSTGDKGLVTSSLYNDVMSLPKVDGGTDGHAAITWYKSRQGSGDAVQRSRVRAMSGGVYISSQYTPSTGAGLDGRLANWVISEYEWSDSSQHYTTRNWADGTTEVWYEVTVSSHTGSSYGALFYESRTFTLPVTFKAAPTVQASVKTNGTGLYNATIHTVTTSQVGMHITNAINETQSVTVHIYAKGKRAT